MKNPTHCFREINTASARIKIAKLKVKLQRAGARERKKECIFVTFTLSEGNFFNICALSQFMVYSINF